MPIYEYQCHKCGTFEVMQRITESPLKRCPTCKGKVERLVSRTSFVLKGSGWYVTDYGRTGSHSDSSSSADSGANGKADSSSKSSETPAKASDTDKSTAKSASSGKAGDSGKAAG